MDGQNLEKLVTEAQAGSEQAFHELYALLVDRLFAYTVSRVRNRDEAMDIVQEIFIDIWKALPRFTYQTDGHVYGFVFLVAKRKLAKHYANRKITVPLEDVDLSDMYEFDTDSLSDAQTITKAMEHLSERDREVLTLRYWSGLSFQEIADMLEEKETTVKVRHHRALEKMSTIIRTFT